MEDSNPLLAEYVFAISLSGRLYPNSRSGVFKRTNYEALNTQDDLQGFFRGLPMEIIHQILRQLDLTSLANLACTSKGMRRVVCALPELQRLLNYAPDAMRAVTAAEVGHRLICSDVYKQLIKPDCDDCNRPGEYLHLLACKRLCAGCLRNNRRYRALRPMQAVEQYSLPLCDVTRLPALVVPRYSPLGRKLRRFRRRLQINTTGWKLIDQEDVIRLCIETHGSVDQGKRLASERLTQLRAPYNSPLTNEAWLESSMNQRRADLMASRESQLVRRRHRNLEGRLRAHTRPDVESAYSVSTFFPWLDISDDCFGRPLFCTLCRDAGEPRHKCYYTSPGHERHMEKHATRSD